MFDVVKSSEENEWRNQEPLLTPIAKLKAWEKRSVPTKLEPKILKSYNDLYINTDEDLPESNFTNIPRATPWTLTTLIALHPVGQWNKFRWFRWECNRPFGDIYTMIIKGKLFLREVYYIPSLCNNIMSLGQLSEVGNKVVLKGEYLWIHDNKKKLMMKVDK